jgi:CO/xanthine dehydrogenase Mo-binding subunit
MGSLIGTGRRRLEGGIKVRGEISYAGDLQLPGLTHARLVLCPHSAARIVEIDDSAAASSPGVLAVVSGADLKGVAAPAPFLLAAGRAAFAGQPVAVVVAESEALAADAAALVQVRYEPLPAVVDAESALDPAAPSVIPGRPNLTDHVLMEAGDVEAAMATCTTVVEGRYQLPPVHQTPIEPHVVVASYRPGSGFTVRTPTQSLFAARDLCAAALGVPGPSVRVVPTPVGGGFGGKLGVLLEPLAAWLARRVGRPLRLALTRSEEFLLGGRSTGGSVELKLGADADGRLRALVARVVIDNGAGPGFPASRVGAFLARPYRLLAYRLDCSGAMTNTPPATAYRGQPAALACFALESAVDELAQARGEDPIEFRLRNLRRAGDPDPAGGIWPRVGGAECLEAARPWLARMGRRAGLAYGVWDGYEGTAAAHCRLDPDGSLTVQVGTADISGTSTTLAMLAADVLGMPLERVAVEFGDSATAPHSLGAGGSAVTRVLGSAVVEAVTDVRRQLLEIASEELEVAVDDLELEADEIRVKGVPGRACSVPELTARIYGAHSRWPPIHGRGRARLESSSPMATVHVAEVDVDQETGAWRLISYAAIQDVGRALNPDEVVAQVHGGAMQGIGRAFGEELAWDATGGATLGFFTYELPTIEVAPPMAVELVEVPCLDGPLGARGAGEPPILPGPPAIANAIARATGVRLRKLPLAPEGISQASNSSSDRPRSAVRARDEDASPGRAGDWRWPTSSPEAVTGIRSGEEEG